MDSAYHYIEKSKFHIEASVSNDYYKGNLALINLKRGQLSALVSLRLVIDRLKILKDFHAVADYLSELSYILMHYGELDEAIEAGEESLYFSKPLGLKEQIRDASQNLSALYKLKGDYESSLRFLKQYVIYMDSTVNVRAINGLADMRSEFEISQRQLQVDLLKAQNKREQYVLIGASLFFLVLLVLVIVISKNSKEKTKVTLKLEAQKKDLESLNQTKDRFFSIISHDLRGPVNSFHGISRMIKYMVRNRQMDQLKELAEDMDLSVNRLSNLLDNLLNWAVQQQGHFSYTPEKLHVYAIVEDLKEIFHTMAHGKQITIQSDVNEDTYIWGDRNMTMTIFRNLFSNALKFTPEGGKVSLKAHENGSRLELTISDTGVGISQNKLEDIFKLQAHKSTWGTQGEKGLGLGLQLVQEFVALNNGYIKVESAEKRGTTFLISLPSFEKNAEVKAPSTSYIMK